MKFQRFVRPQINSFLTEFFKELTSIRQAHVDGARTYEDIGQELGGVYCAISKRCLGVVG